jgi:predicted PurR-regulated permease PerM
MTPLDEYDRSRIAFWAAALALGFVLAFVLYAYVGTFVLGLFVYYITRPIYRRLADRVRPNALAAAVALLTIALPIVLLIAYTAIVAAGELTQLAGDAGGYADLVGPYLNTTTTGGDPRAVVANVTADPGRYLGSGATGAVGTALVSLAGYLGGAANALLHLFVVLAIAFYLLRDDHRLAGWFRAEFAARDSPAETYLSTVDANLKTIYFGNILNAFAVAIVAAVSYTVLDAFAPGGLGVPSPVLAGLLTGLGSLIPVVGPKLVWVPLAVAIAIQAMLVDPAFLWFPVAFALVALVVVDTIPDVLLRPYVSGRDLHTGLVLIAYIVGPLLFGWYGLFFGPLLLVLIVHFARILLAELVRGEPLTGRATADNPLDPGRDDVEEPEPDPTPVDPDAAAGTDTGDGSGGVDDRASTRDGDRTDSGRSTDSGSSGGDGNG